MKQESVVKYILRLALTLLLITGVVAAALAGKTYRAVEKPTFGSVELPALVAKAAEGQDFTLELMGLCTDICVVSNTLLLKAAYPEVPVTVDAACCAGVTPATHNAALTTMEMCQIDVKNKA